MSYKVVSDSANPQLWKVLVTAKYAKVNVEQQLGADPSSKDNKAPKLPYLETAEGTIFEANAIARYIARLGKGTLYGSNDFEAGQIEQFITWSASDIELPGSVWIYPILGYIQNNSIATQKAKGDVRKALDYLNKHLLTRTFLVGNRVTVADIVVALSLFYLYQKVLDLGFRKQYVNTNRWFLTVVNQPEFKSVVGDFTLAEKMEVAPEVEAPAETEAPKEAKKPKEEKPKVEKPKKEAKKPAKDEDAEEEDEFADKEAKKPNVLDSLPPTKFILDEWKRVYSNANDTRADANPWFWNNLDKAGYSLWLSDYKYNNECEKEFMTCNLIGGWFQRLDKVRKYAFGSVVIFGKEPKLEVSGVWLFRGLDIPQEMREVDDFEHYNWRKINPEDAAERELVNDYWAWDGSFGGSKTFNQGKIFK